MQSKYVAGQLDEIRHLFYTDPRRWQVIEERVNSSSDAERQFIWGLCYIDELISRERDTGGNGTLDERLYGLQDANWSVAAIADSSGVTQERYAYDAPAVEIQMQSPRSWKQLSASIADSQRTIVDVPWAPTQK